ncbi:mannitol dehydrogenase family protein [Modestobacter italicus]|uniref:mannitol dehydrogenase family protein n=1 Tax=Modestobacter italicus (strain DSM 44449 / CECT 9708 / BC 501) TaxID=2732864 RepID=UPI0027E039F2|nr:mannitol dehydrogenase family protein [Modestobacter italicus]
MSSLRRTTAAPPVRLVHLGLGAFSRAHQAWYTDRAPDAEGWGIAAFTGRRPDLAEALAAQDGLYTLVTRAAGGDDLAVVRSVVSAHPATDGDAWLTALAAPEVAAVTLTVTEAGYLRDAAGRLDTADPRVVADVAALRDGPGVVRTAPGRLVAGLLARRRADAGPLALVSCDNLPDNGAVLRTVVEDLAALVDPSLLAWAAGQVSYVTTVVDRITPAPTDADRQAVRAATGVDDRSPVVTEPFSEWVLAGDFPAGRPRWDASGAVLTSDVAPYEERKLWLLNAAHSILAYTGPARGHVTVADAVADPVCRGLVEAWWDTCTPHLRLTGTEVTDYRDALLERFGNPRIRHALAQIGVDGSQKLPVRIVPVLLRERAAGRLSDAAVAVLAGWSAHVRDASPLRDVRADELTGLASGPPAVVVPQLLSALSPGLGDDAGLVAAVRGELGAATRR